MKKLTVTALIVFLAIAMISCSKTSYLDVTAATPADQLPKTEVNVVSNWLTPVSFSQETDRSGNPFIKAMYSFTAASQVNYNEDAHVELVYVKIPTNQRMQFYQYRKLPLTINIDANGHAGNVLLDHSLDPDELKLYFKNAAYILISKAVDQSVSESWNFRYIIIPKSKYNALNIDWDDLSAVAAALNFSL